MKTFNQNSLQKFFHGVETYSGIKLGHDKVSLLQNRLRDRLDELQIQDLDDYNAILLTDPFEMQICSELLTTHKTEWFREIVHYEFLQEQLVKRNKNETFTFWSAACSSGQELYSTLFLLLKNRYDPSQFRLLGTDLSSMILDKARTLHETDEFARQVSNFKVRNPGADVDNIMKRAIQNSVKFKEFNLLHTDVFVGIKFDVIFLRNVLIYFDAENVKKVVDRLSSCLKPGGYLITGLSEPLGNDHKKLVKIGPSIYHFKG